MWDFTTCMHSFGGVAATLEFLGPEAFLSVFCFMGR